MKIVEYQLNGKKRHGELMGVDVYLRWSEMTDQDKENQITGYMTVGKYGYLRGAYFGGFADILEYLFEGWEWSKDIPFGSKEQAIFEKRIDELSIVRGRRESKHGKAFENLPDLFGGSGAEVSFPGAEAPFDEDELKEYRDFLNLARRLSRSGKKVWVEISY